MARSPPITNNPSRPSTWTITLPSSRYIVSVDLKVHEILLGPDPDLSQPVVVIVTIRYHNQLDKEEYETEEAAILHGAGRTYFGQLEMPSSSSLDWGGSYVSRTHG
ncbi:hypothetical protein MLD38_000316 [Melastoma candidum]|uniref:Uncharacterized protein n=1 Tax=Melastoma candidum TaxID=119954 RepID=A0ACB9SEL8_9MYRT|nr:hypothetical protein MLD38_000316 [Melastoma candidum]